MQQPKAKARIWQLVRIGVSVCVVAFIVSRVPWHSKVTLAGGGNAVDVLRIVENGVYVRAAAGGERFVPASQIDTVEGANGQRELAIEKGIRDELGNLRWWAIFAAVVAFAGAPFFQALRWRQLLHVQDCRLSVGAAVRLMWIGLLFNMFLLGAVGGDLVKAYYVSKHSHARAESVITVLVDRIIGLLGLLWLSAAAIVVWLIMGARQIPGGLPWAWMLPGVVVLLGGAVFYSKRIRGLLGLDRLIGRLPEDHMVRRLDRAVFLYRHHKAIVGQAFLLTFLSHLCLLGSVYFANVAVLNPPAPPIHVLVFAPIIFVGAGIIPSVGGLGVQEYGFILFFSRLGLCSRAAALFLGIVVRLAQIVVSLPGALLLMLGGHLPSRAQMQAEMQQATT